MKRREFMMLLGGTAVAWPLAVRAQQSDRMQLIGMLNPFAESDREGQVRLSAFREKLRELGWTEGQNIKIEIRWGSSDAERARAYVAELVALAPDVILANSSPNVAALLQATRTVPTVFMSIPDPVGTGFVDSLARPGGNATGFTTFEYAMSAKWIELLKEMAPRIKGVAVLLDPTSPGGLGEFGAARSVEALLQVQLQPVDVRDTVKVERMISALVPSSTSGLIVLPGEAVVARRHMIIELAARHRLPAVYPYRYYVADGGLISYGPDLVDPYRRAAGYVDRILKGEKPAALPAPTKYDLVINLKTAKAIGLEVPPMLLARVDEVIE